MMNKVYAVLELEYGRLLPEAATREVPAADPSGLELPERCVSVRFYERTETQEPSTGELLVGAPRWHPKTYYPGAKVETREEIEARADPSEGILRENIRCNGWAGVLRTRGGRFLPDDPGRDVILP